jgi:hypothetical protein
LDPRTDGSDPEILDRVIEKPTIFAINLPMNPISEFPKWL